MPTASFAVEPTRLFSPETAPPPPMKPLAPLPHVAAPREPFQLELTTTKLLLPVSAVAPAEPTRLPAVLPVRVLMRAPVVPLKR